MSDCTIGEHGSEPLSNGAVTSFGEPPEGDWETSNRFDAELFYDDAKQCRREPTGEKQGLAGESWGDVVESLAGDEDEASDSCAVGNCDELGERSAGVVADEYDVAKIELFDESFDESRQRGEGESQFGWSGLAVGSHRQRWDDAAMVGTEVLDHRRPECFVHEQPMQEHDHGTGGARCDVLNRASFDDDLIHARTRPFAKLERSGPSCATVRRNAISAVTHSSNDSRNGA